MVDGIVLAASEESHGLGHNYIGTEHLLCAIVATADSNLQILLRRFLLSADSARKAVVAITRSGPHQSFHGTRPLTPRLKQVLSRAEAQCAHNPSLALSQILLLTLIEAQGVGARSLSSLGIDMDRFVEDLKTPNQPPEPTSGLAPGRGSF